MNRAIKVISVVAMVVLLNITGFCVSFADTQEVSIGIDDSVTTAAVSPGTYISTGICTGDGVKFKAGPSSSSTTLGLLYKGEVLYLHNPPAGVTSSYWSYVYRVKTGQFGYMASQYFRTTAIGSVGGDSKTE